jgi:hypothetical protein
LGEHGRRPPGKWERERFKLARKPYRTGNRHLYLTDFSMNQEGGTPAENGPARCFANGGLSAVLPNRS